MCKYYFCLYFEITATAITNCGCTDRFELLSVFPYYSPVHPIYLIVSDRKKERNTMLAERHSFMGAALSHSGTVRCG